MTTERRVFPMALLRFILVAGLAARAFAQPALRFEVATVKLAAPDAVRTVVTAAAGEPESAAHPEHDAVDANLFRVR